MSSANRTGSFRSASAVFGDLSLMSLRQVADSYTDYDVSEKELSINYVRLCGERGGVGSVPSSRSDIESMVKGIRTGRKVSNTGQFCVKHHGHCLCLKRFFGLFRL